MTTITVFGKPGCPGCKTTIQHLDKLGLPYVYRDITEDQAAHDEVTLLGYQGLPVVTVGDLHWSGYRHGKIQRLAQIHVSAPDITVLESEAVEYLADEASA